MHAEISFVISLCLIINEMTISAFTWIDGSRATKKKRVPRGRFTVELLKQSYLYGKPNDVKTP